MASIGISSFAAISVKAGVKHSRFRSNGGRVFAKEAANWLPGSERPSYLDGSLPGDYGFDPIGLGSSPESLERFVECEIFHCRWAMLGAAGVLIQELTGQGSWVDAPKWALDGGSATYFGVSVPFSLPLLIIFEAIMVGGAEYLRQTSEPEMRKYPGGAFNPLGYGKDPEKLEILKKKEIANGRLAMVSMLGFYVQAAVTGEGATANLFNHLNSPWEENISKYIIVGF